MGEVVGGGGGETKLKTAPFVSFWYIDTEPVLAVENLWEWYSRSCGSNSLSTSTSSNNSNTCNGSCNSLSKSSRSIVSWNSMGSSSKTRVDPSSSQWLWRMCLGTRELDHKLRDSFDPLRKRVPKHLREKFRKKTTEDGRPLCKVCGQVCGKCRHTREKV